MRGQGKRPWIKLHIIPCLEGSIRHQLDPAQRGVWYDLILFAGIQPEPGLIADSDQRPYPHSFIASRLNIELGLLDETLKACRVEGRITEDEHGIKIVNWKVYQSEYQRQKPYREKERHGKKENKVCHSCNYKAFTDETWCPDCEKEGKKTELVKDYKGQKYANIVQS